MIPSSVAARVGRRTVPLTNLAKVYWPEEGITKGALLQYYLDVAEVLVPHVRERPMVMKRYPHGIAGDFFFMKRAPTPRPQWIQTRAVEHRSGNVIDFPLINDAAALAWLVNLGCIDLNPWYARSDDIDRPDYLVFDLDPSRGATFDHVRSAAIVVRDALDVLGMKSYVKTSGSKGIHVYVPIERGPTQKQVWAFAKAVALKLAAHYPELLTAEYRIAKRPKARVLVDYNQNAWGRTLASVYSVRPRPLATVSTPVAWSDIERGVAIEDFRIDTVPARIARCGDLWKGLLAKRGRFPLERYV